MKLTAPVYAQFELTYKCNLRCGGCYNPTRFGEVSSCGSAISTDAPKREDISLDDVERIGHRGADWGVFVGALTGGEVMSAKQRALTLLKVFKKRNVRTTMNTNGTLLHEDIIKEFLDNGLESMLMSLHSCDPQLHDEIVGVPYAFEKTLLGMQLVKEADPEFNIYANAMLSRQNAHTIYDTGILLSQLGVDGFTVSQLTPSRENREKQISQVLDEEGMIKALHDLVRVHEDTGLPIKLQQGLPHCFLLQEPKFKRFLTAGCDAGDGYVTINPYGDVTPCSQISDRFGNVLTDDLSEIWKKLNDYQTGGMIPEECQPCDIKNECRGGCRAEAERRTGTNLTVAHPFMKEPIKRERVVEVPDISHLSGKTFSTKRFSYREENGCYLVSSGTTTGHVLFSPQEFGLLGAMNESPLTVTDDLLNSPMFTGFLHYAVKHGLVKEAIKW